MQSQSLAPRALLQLLGVAMVPVAVVAFACHQRNIPDEIASRDRDTFNPRALLQEMQRDKPEWVLIGNSMLGSRVTDESKLGGQSGMKVKVIAKGGSQSATWFLILKRIIAESETRPKWLTVFFRHTDLTWADLRTTGVQADAIVQMDGPAQPEWREVLGGGRSASVNKVESMLKGLFPSNYLNFEDRRLVQRWSFDLTRMGADAGLNKRRTELNERFSLAHLRHDLGGDMASSNGPVSDDQDDASYDLGPRVFDPSPKASFLPHMVALAREHGISVHFHRVKCKPRGASRQSDWLTRYMTDLGGWLRESGCALTDETGEPALTRDMYADGDHISGDANIQDRYRKVFLSIAMPVVRDTKTATDGN